MSGQHDEWIITEGRKIALAGAIESLTKVSGAFAGKEKGRYGVRTCLLR